MQFQSAVLGPPQPSAVQTMVEDCFREPIAVRGYVQSLQVDPDRILQRTKAVSLGLLATASSTTTDTTATSTTTTDDNGAASSSEQPKPESSRLVQWGDWNNLNFLVFVSVVGGVLLLWVLAASCDACRKRRQKRRDQAGFALVSHKKSGETEAIPSPTSTDDHNDPSFTKVGDKQKRTISLHKASSSAASETVDAILEQSSQADSCSVGAVMKPRMIDDSRAEYEGENSSLSASEAASIYSYIQSTVWGEEDNCYSVADGSALMHYNPHIPGVDEPSTTNWSVADGDVTTLTLENDYENVQLLPATTTTATPDEGKTSLEGSLSRIKSTGGGAVRSQNSNGDNGLFTTDGPSEVMIFCDGGTDEDTMSLISESMIVTALDYGHDRGFPVRKLSAAAGSQMTNKQQSDHRDGSVNASSNANNLDYSFAAQSTSSQLLGDEVNQSFADSSVSLTSYQVTPYAKERVLDPIDPDPMEAAPSQSATLVSALIEGNGNNRNGAAAGSEELSLEETQLPFRTRSRTTNSSVETGTSTNGDSSNLGGSRSSSSHKPPLSSFVLRSTSFKKPQGGAAPVQPVGVSNSKENNDDTNNITGFLTRSARISKASQVALHSGSSSRDSSSQRQSQASMATEIQGTVRSHFTLQSQVISTVEQDQESESDIQSICSNDDHSLFSFASKVERLSNHAAASPASRGSTFLSQQERSLLGAHPHDVPTTNDDEDNEGDYICLPADYN